MAISLRRESDGAGDSGLLSMIHIPIYDDVGGQIVRFESEQNARPRVGVIMEVGSPFARTYSAQDFWRTSLITEILEDTPNRVRFRTKNSIYVWEVH